MEDTSTPTLPPLPLNPSTFSKDTPTRDIENSDIELTNAAAHYIYQGWCNTNMSLKELSTLFKLTVDFTKHRRKIMEMPYGSEDSKAKRTVVYPVD